MRHLLILLTALGFILYLHEITAHAQRGPVREPRIRDTSRTGQGRGNSLDRRREHKTDVSRTREAMRTDNLSARKSLNDQLSRNTKLAARLQGLLGNQNLQKSAEGFKSLGQFVAAVHVSNNLGISFDALKMRMADPESPDSLGRAIRELRPEVDATNEVNMANEQAADDLEQSSQ
jgi:hypothetical protein